MSKSADVGGGPVADTVSQFEEKWPGPLGKISYVASTANVAASLGEKPSKFQLEEWAMMLWRAVEDFRGQQGERTAASVGGEPVGYAPPLALEMLAVGERGWIYPTGAPHDVALYRLPAPPTDRAPASAIQQDEADAAWEAVCYVVGDKSSEAIRDAVRAEIRIAAASTGGGK